MVETAAESWLGDSATFARLTVDGVGAAEGGVAAAAAKREGKFRICQLKCHYVGQTLLLYQLCHVIYGYFSRVVL